MSTDAEKKIRVMLVDDSAVSRKMCRRLLARYPLIEIVSEADQPYRAMEILSGAERPDVIVLDLEMPKMDGMTFLKLMMKSAPMPIVIFSAIARPNSAVLMEALAAGAIEVVGKPENPGEFESVGRRLHEAILAASLSDPRKRATAQPPPAAAETTVSCGAVEVIAIGASTGGPQALQAILPGVPVDSPPILLVQHLPAALTAEFVLWFGKQVAHRVVCTEEVHALERGMICVGPPDGHLRLKRHAGNLFAHVTEHPHTGLHRPSIDVLFESVASTTGSALGVILTGMGRDGAQGLLAMRRAGAHTIAEDPETCVVDGMPMESLRLAAACDVVRLENISDRIQAIALGETSHART